MQLNETPPKKLLDDYRHLVLVDECTSEIVTDNLLAVERELLLRLELQWERRDSPSMLPE